MLFLRRLYCLMTNRAVRCPLAMQRCYKSVRVFNNPLLERLTHVHPAVPLLLWGPVVSFLIWRAVRIHHLNTMSLGGVALLALFSWTLAEYFLHRMIFHFEGKSALAKRLHFLIHGLHHEDPQDFTRLVMPPVASLILAIMIFPLFYLLLGPVWGEAFFGFFVVGYLCYDYAHFYMHRFSPQSNIGKSLKNHHMQHHYVNPNSRWGVSTPLWDFVFGTLESSEQKPHPTQHSFMR